MSSLETPWQQSLARAVTRFDTLCELLKLDISDTPFVQHAQQSFPLRVPHEFIARMEKNNVNDPLLLQVLPQAIELQRTENFSKDPLEENQHNPVPGLLHKYPNRVLLTLTGGCAIHCRYCFRRHFPYQDNLPGRHNWQNALNYIKAHNEIDEVILSGGDPMILKDHLIAEFNTQLSEITHIQRLRIHTRLPIVIPSRVTEEWLAWMRASHFSVVVVVHCNHPNEIDSDVKNALKKLRTAATVLNQSVLLKNINENTQTLVSLSKKLFDADVLPYYLHLLDKVDGAAHFDLLEERANVLIAELKKQLPGYLVPTLAREVPGLDHKLY